MRLYIDCDGVLTDGRLMITADGEKPFKCFHARDVTAIRGFVRQGWEVTIVSADDWPGNEIFAKKVGAAFLCDGKKDALPQPYYAIGDSVLDLDMLARAEAAFCPADADALIREMPGVQCLETAGGHGVMAELVVKLLIVPALQVVG